MDGNPWPPNSTVVTNKLEALEDNFSLEEIKKAIWEFGVDKAPGYDNFSIFFYRYFLELVKKTWQLYCRNWL